MSHFINTVEPRVGKHPQDVLTEYVDLVRWSRYAQVATEEQAQRLIEEASTHKEEATSVFSQAIALREALYRIFIALIHHTAPASSNLQLLQTFVVETIEHGHLAVIDSGLQW